MLAKQLIAAQKALRSPFPQVVLKHSKKMSEWILSTNEPNTLRKVGNDNRK